MKKKITRLFVLFVVFGISGISAVSASSSSIYASFSSSAKPVLSGVNGTSTSLSLGNTAGYPIKLYMKNKTATALNIYQGTFKY